jgi:hypothetical protein
MRGAFVEHSVHYPIRAPLFIMSFGGALTSCTGLGRSMEEQSERVEGRTIGAEK